MLLSFVLSNFSFVIRALRFIVKSISSLLALVLWNQEPRFIESTTPSKAKNPEDIRCPYEYVVSAYGRNHFKGIVQVLDPDFERRDPELYALVLEIMDKIHFGAIMVDDVADNSMLRKGVSAAHRIYGPSETINRAYLKILNTVKKFATVKPSYILLLLNNLAEIHQGMLRKPKHPPSTWIQMLGQDDSLVWRRDGFGAHPDISSALSAYQACASLKTGALFRLVGQLVTGTHEMDDIMSDFGYVIPTVTARLNIHDWIWFRSWYCQLQNDCKNIFSTDVISAKGALAEDLINGEYTYPIIIGLHASDSIRSVIKEAFNLSGKQNSKQKKVLQGAIQALQSEEVQSVCLKELEAVRSRNKLFVAAWGRTEVMSISTIKTIWPFIVSDLLLRHILYPV